MYSRLLRRAHRLGAALVLPLIVPALCTAPLIAQTTAVSATVAITNGGFENTSIVRSQYNPTWSGWFFVPQFYTPGPPAIQGGSGIAKNGCPLLAQSNPTTAGSYVAFVEGVGTVRTTVTSDAGQWHRIRFLAAARKQGTTADPQVLRVDIGTTTVFEQQLTETWTEYVTDQVWITTGGSLDIWFRGQSGSGDYIGMIDAVVHDPVPNWSNSATWSSGVPDDADTVLVPEGVTVAMNVACVADTVRVNGSLVAAPVSCSLTADWVMVEGEEASFVVGTEQAPFQQQFTLTLEGEPSEENIDNCGTKFLAAMDGGRIDMHGQPKKSWTKLKSVAGNVIEVADAVTWQPGDEIVVASSEWMKQDEDPLDEQPVVPYTTRSEVRTITAVDAGTGALTLNAAFTYFHCAVPTSPYTAQSQTWTLDERAEVGLLTHNVRIEGDTSSTNSQFGAHVMLMKCPNCMFGPGSGRFSYVQMTRMGQRSPAIGKPFALGRYPMHWHMQLANGQGQFLRGSSIRESYNRAVTIHGSDYVTVEDNVAFDQYGHAIFFEDGGERYNKILRNLVIWTRRPAAGTQLLTTDNAWDQPQNRSPAAFWITNPQNEFVGNVAAESVGTGYWFALHKAPFGLSAAEAYYNPGQPPVPLNATVLPLGKFEDNVCHGCKNAIDLNDSVEHKTPPSALTDELQPNYAWNPPSPVVFERFVAYGCATALYAGTGNNKVTFNRCVLADNAWHIQFACAFTTTNSLLLENSQTGIFQPTHSSFCGFAYLPYDGPGRLTNSHLVGFDGSLAAHASVVGSVTGAAVRHANHVLSGLSFSSATPRIEFFDFSNVDPLVDPSKADARHWGIAVANLDGTLSGLSNRTLVTNHPMMHLTSGTTPDVEHTPGTRGWWSPHKWAHVQIIHYKTGGSLLMAPDMPTMTWTRDAYAGSPGATHTATYNVTGWWRQLPLICRRAADVNAAECRYTVAWTPPSNVKKLELFVDDIASGDVTRLALENQTGWTNEVVKIGSVTLTPVASEQALDGLTSTAYFKSQNRLYLRTVNTSASHKLTITWQ